MLRMADYDTRTILASISLFDGLSESQLAEISRNAHRRVFAAGANIITAEQPGEAVYIILSGTVKIHIEQADGRDVILSILGAGDTVGEMSLIDSAGRSASAITIEDSMLLWMDKGSFQRALSEYPQFAQNLIRILSARVRLANELIQALAALDVNGRVARQLLAFADKYGESSEEGSVIIPVNLTQGDIADLVGASRKRVNTVMVHFREQELITINAHGRIVVLNREELARYCR